MTKGDQLIRDFVAGRYVAKETGRPVPCPIRRIEMGASLDGAEAELVRSVGLAGRIGVVSDENTHDVLGRRVALALGDCEEIVLDHPHADEETTALLQAKARHVDALVAVGSGTINDLCKHATFEDGRPTAVFATAPSMNGYVTSTASISQGGYKNSLKSKAPVGVFFDLDVQARSPARMIRAGVGDALCRGTARVDWLFSHLLLGTAYFESPYDMQMADEPLVIGSTGRLLDGDLDAMAALVRLLTLGGLGVVITGTSHSGSMGEHGISHYVDMLAKPHPGSLHGEQVGVATVTMTRLQGELLSSPTVPLLAPTAIDEPAMRARYGALADACIKGLEAKRITPERADQLNDRLERNWADMQSALLALMLPLERLVTAMRACGAATVPEEIGIDPAFWGEAVGHAHEIRDRFSMLDLAAHTGRLAAFAAREARP